MAGAHGDHGVAPSGPGLPRLPGRHPVPPDRGALHAILGPSASALVLHWRDADDVAASPAGIAVGAAGMEAAPAATRCALPAAIGVVGIGRPVLLVSTRQARRLHHAGAADGLPRARAVAAGHRAQVVGATTGTRIRTCVHPGDDGCRAGHAAGSYWFRGQTDRRARPAARCGAVWLDAAGDGGGLGSLLWFGLRRPIAVLLSTLTFIWVLYGLVAYPLLNPSSSATGLMAEIDGRLAPDAQLGLVAWKEQILLMSRRPAMTFGFKVPIGEQLRRGVAWQRQAPRQRWLLVQEPAMSKCIDRSKVMLGGRSNRRIWWLVPATAVVPGCVITDSELQDTDGD